MRRNMLTLLALLLPSLGFAKIALPLGQALPPLTISGEHGGYVSDGKPWSSQSLPGKMTFIVYVDPDDKDLNDQLAERLKAENLPHEFLGSLAIINLAASWKPNSLIMSALREKQKEYPHTTYVYDKDRTVAATWKLPSEGYHVLLVDKAGRLLFEKNGQFSSQEIESFLGLIRAQASKDMSEKEEVAHKEEKKSL